MQTILEFGIRIAVSLQGLGNWLILPMKFFSFLGTEDFYIIVLPVLYWCVDSALGMRVALILMLSSGLNETLKMVFHVPRPYWASSQVKGLAEETSFDMPSAHGQHAVVVWGLIAAYLRKWWAWLAAVLIIVLIGFSRLYLGVHFLHDILLGWLVGGLLLWLTVRFWDPVVAWAKKLTIGRQLLISFLVSLALLLLALIPYIWLKATHWQAPQEWASYAKDAVSLEITITSAGMLFGLLAGLAWMARQGGFQVKGRWWELVLRYLAGVAGVLIIRYGLKFIFPAGENVLSYVFRYLRYTLIGFWLTGGAPWTFIRLRLARRNQP